MKRSAAAGRHAAIGIALFGLLALLGASAPWKSWEARGFDYLSVLSATGQPVAPITIVGIDEPSFAELQLQWPWPRSLHARLLRQLAKAGAAVIAFDVVFAEPSAPEADAELAAAIREAGNVVLAADIQAQEGERFSQVLRVLPLPSLLQAGAVSGQSAVDLDRDLVLRQLPLDPGAFWRSVLRSHPDAAIRALAESALEPGSRIRFAGGDHSFRYVSYYQALDPDLFLPPGSLSGRVVLIGRDVRTSPDAKADQTDMFATPFSLLTRSRMPGVEAHANMIETIWRGQAIREVPYPITLLVLGGVLGLAALSMREWRPLRSALVALAAAASAPVLSLWLLASASLWLPFLSPVLGVLVLYVGHGGVAFLEEQRRRLQIKRAFSHYVSPDVVNDLIAHPEKLVLGGERRELTLLFTDLAGFTSLSEELPPEEIARILNHHLTEMTRILLAHGGTVDKFIGDAVMAFWNAPLEDPEHVLHGCQAALEMQAAMKLMRADFLARKLPPVHMRVGLHCGVAVVGNMGSEQRFDYSAIGDSVNLAARLEGVNKLYGTEILVSGAVASALFGRLPLRGVDRVKVKGKALPVDIFTLHVDPRLQPVNDQAITAYRAKQWDRSIALWEDLLRVEPDDSIAKVYLKRIPSLRADPPPDPWDGSLALEKM